jgi:hypothetical protein
MSGMCRPSSAKLKKVACCFLLIFAFGGCTAETLRVAHKTAFFIDYTEVVQKEDTVYLGFQVKGINHTKTVHDLWTTMKPSQTKKREVVASHQTDIVGYSEPNWSPLPREIVSSSQQILIMPGKKHEREEVESSSSNNPAVIFKAGSGAFYYLVYYDALTKKPKEIYYLSNPSVAWTDYIVLASLPVAAVFDIIFSPFYLYSYLSK